MRLHGALRASVWGAMHKARQLPCPHPTRQQLSCFVPRPARLLLFPAGLWSVFDPASRACARNGRLITCGAQWCGQCSYCQSQPYPAGSPRMPPTPAGLGCLPHNAR